MDKKNERELRNQKILFIMDRLDAVVQVSKNQPAVIYYYLFDGQQENFREELVQLLLQCDEVTQQTYDLDFYNLLMSVFHNVARYIQKLYNHKIISKEEYETNLLEIRKYCKMVPEPNIKVFRLSRLQEKKLLGKNR